MPSNIADDSDIWTSVGPLYILLQWMLSGQFRAKGKSKNRRFILINHFSCYKLGMYLLTITTVVFIIAARDFIFQSSKNVVRQSVTTIKIFNSFVLVLMSIICYVLHGPRVLKVFNKIVETDAEFLKLGQTINNKFACEQNIFYAICYGLIMAFLNFGIFSFKKMYFLTAMYQLIINVYQYVMVMLFRSWLYAIQQRLFAVHSFIGNISHNNSSLQNLKSAQKIFENLCMVLKEITAAQGIPLLLILMNNFLNISIQCYTVYGFLNKDFMYHHLVEISIYVIDTLVTMIYGNNIKKQECVLKQQLCKLFASHKDVYLRKEINAFSLQLLHEDVSVDILGFLKIDFSLLFAMAGAITTYIVILVQFDHSLYPHQNTASQLE